MAVKLTNRKQVASRWGCSTRKVDRLRADGLLPWIDLAGGKGKRPIVRFRDEHVEEFENKYLMDINRQKEKKS